MAVRELPSIGYGAEIVRIFVCDSFTTDKSDEMLISTETNLIPMGSRLTDINNNTIYLMDSNGEWKKFSASSGGGGGGGVDPSELYILDGGDVSGY